MLPRGFILILILMAFGPNALGQVNLVETPRPGDLARYRVDLAVNGRLLVTQEGKPQEVSLTAKAQHRFTEKIIAVAGGLPARSVRYFEEATAAATIGSDKDEHKLPADRRLFLAARTADGSFCFSPSGPVTREELDLVAEHFDPHCLPGLLPGKAVNIGDAWAIGNAAAQTAGLFDSLVKNSLAGKFTELKDGVATFTITGTMDGVENGSKVSLTVNSEGKFSVAAGLITELLWRQKDDREVGPVSPSSKVEAIAVVKRERIAEEPKEIAAAPLGEPTVQNALLRFADAKGRYRFEYPRNWHITTETDEHLVLRLLDRGEFTAQATITAWRRAEPGEHASVEEFKKAIADSPGWKSERVFDDGEVAVGGGRWLYRLVAEGKMAEQPAVQGFHMLAGPRGHQVAVTFAMKPEKVKALAGRDLSLLKAIEFDSK